MLKQLLLSAVVVSSGLAAKAQVPVIKIDGSSTVFPITEAMAEEFQTAQKGKVRVTVGISGTGGGFKKFCRAETDVQNASRPISASEMEACAKAGVKFMELPIAYDATAVVVNPKNTWIKSMTVAELKKMWEPGAQGKISKWSDVNPAWPKENLKLYGAGADSGTFDYFTEAIVGKSKSSRGDYTASEDDNTLVTGISKDLHSLGYVPLAYYEENKDKLKVVAIIGGDKAPAKNEAIMPSRATVEAGTYFPLSRPIFIYVSDKAMAKKEVKDFVNFYISQAGSIVPEVKYVPLPPKAYDLVKENIKKNKMGTLFGGHSEIGLKIEELMKREGSL